MQRRIPVSALPKGCSVTSPLRVWPSTAVSTRDQCGARPYIVRAWPVQSWQRKRPSVPFDNAAGLSARGQLFIKAAVWLSHLKWQKCPQAPVSGSLPETGAIGFRSPCFRRGQEHPQHRCRGSGPYFRSCCGRAGSERREGCRWPYRLSMPSFGEVSGCHTRFA